MGLDRDIDSFPPLQTNNPGRIFEDLFIIPLPSRGDNYAAVRADVHARHGALRFYGANRHGQNLFENSLVALDARTGKRLWHFRTVRHDLWDYDLPTAPRLLTIKYDGKTAEPIAQPTKEDW